MVGIDYCTNIVTVAFIIFKSMKNPYIVGWCNHFRMYKYNLNDAESDCLSPFHQAMQILYILLWYIEFRGHNKCMHFFLFYLTFVLNPGPYRVWWNGYLQATVPIPVLARLKAWYAVGSGWWLHSVASNWRWSSATLSHYMLIQWCDARPIHTSSMSIYTLHVIYFYEDASLGFFFCYG